MEVLHFENVSQTIPLFFKLINHHEAQPNYLNYIQLDPRSTFSVHHSDVYRSTAAFLRYELTRITSRSFVCFNVIKSWLFKCRFMYNH